LRHRRSRSPQILPRLELYPTPEAAGSCGTAAYLGAD